MVPIAKVQKILAFSEFIYPFKNSTIPVTIAGKVLKKVDFLYIY